MPVVSGHNEIYDNKTYQLQLRIVFHRMVKKVHEFLP